MSTVYGIDVSSVQGDVPDVHWQAVAADKRFCYVKAREGNAGNDPCFDQNIAGIRRTDLVPGAYLVCYVLPHSDLAGQLGRDPEDQVQAFFEACDGLGGQPGELPPCLDLEDPNPSKWSLDGVTPAFCEDWTGRAIDKVTALWGRLPVVYTYKWWAEQAKLTKAGGCPLWLANYGGATYRTAAPWTSATILQVRNGTGPNAYRLPNGIPVDENEIPIATDFLALTDTALPPPAAVPTFQNGPAMPLGGSKP